MKKILVIFAFVMLLSGCGENPCENHLTFQEPQGSGAPIPAALPKEIHDSEFSALDNCGSGWGFKKEKGQEPEILIKTQELFQKYDAFYLDPKRTKTIYLTFDEGYENGYTGQILDTLKKLRIPAAFFITEPYLRTEKELVSRMVSEGHTVGNHTVHHPNLPKLDGAEAMAKELSDLNEQFLSEYGIPMQFMRPPEGEYSERVLAVSQAMGYKTIFWSFAYRDWDPKKQQGADYAFSQVTPYLHDGAILLLHAVSKDNADALESILTYAMNQGYQFASLDQLQY